jgi:UDP-glucose 4-epimerase
MSNVSRIVVTGSSGFLARGVIARLTAIGLPCIAVSRRSGAGLHHMASYTETPAADILIHLAEEPDRSKVNLLGEAYLEHAAMVVEKLSERAAIFIYASSGVVYGDVVVTHFGTDECVEAMDVYSGSKIRNEALALSVGGTVLRLSNLFGVGMSLCNVVSDISRQLGRMDPLVVRDDGPVRDFLSVNEAANVIGLLAQTPQPGIFNIGSSLGVSIRELALLALRAVKQQNREIVVAQPSGRRSVNVLDISDTKRCLGWGATYYPLDSLENYFSNGVPI